MQFEDPNEQPLPGDTADIADQPLQSLSEHFSGRLRVIAKLSVTYWFNHDKLDKLLAQYIGSLEGCELIYAIDQGGRQVSSNIYPAKIDDSGYATEIMFTDHGTIIIEFLCVTIVWFTTDHIDNIIRQLEILIIDLIQIIIDLIPIII
jgi:hypothetical protein